MNFNLNLLAQIVGSNFGINVVPGSGFAIGKTPDGHLVLYVPPMAIGDEDDAMIMRSGLCHEAVGHGRHTDFGAKRGPTPLHLSIENVLEDARIEKAAWKIYPKTRRILGEGMAVMHKRNMLKRASNQSTPAEKSAIAVLLRLMVEELGYCQGLLDWKVDWAEAVSCFGNETMGKVWTEAVAGYQVATTAEVITVAARIVKLLSKGFEDQQQQDQSGQGKSDPSGDGKSKPGSGSGESQGDDQGQGQTGDSSKGDEGQDGKGKGSGKEDGDDQAQAGGDGQEGGTDEGGADSGDGQSQGSGNDATGDQAGNGAGGGSSHAAQKPVPLDKNGIKPAEFDRGDILKAQIKVASHYQQPKIGEMAVQGGAEFVPPVDGKAAAQRLKSSLAQRLLAVVEDEDDSLVESGILASSRLVDARLGDRFVFAEPGKPGERLDTAFSILIDMSGSMSGVSDSACLAATWAIGDTLNGYAGMGLAFTVSSFNGGLFLLKDWNAPWKRGGPLSSYRASGCTYTYGAVESRLAHLVKRSEKRKVLYLITDGDIGDLSSLVNSAKEMDTEIVVMMIGDESQKPAAPYLKRFSVVRPDKIATEMLKTVTSLF